ncbi:MAG: HipA family kinase, partial [Pseudomonas sp.]
MPIEIEEIMTRSVQGVTRPFVCRGEDGEVYFVKGMGAGRRSQICELVAGKLAVAFGIPIAPFELVNIPADLLAIGGRNDLAELGPGIAFGSRRCRVTELTQARVAEVPPELATDVLVFDLWIKNEDRTLTEFGGNPNLFWDVSTEELVVFDHNQAFDPGFSRSTFLNDHAFSS